MAAAVYFMSISISLRLLCWCTQLLQRLKYQNCNLRGLVHFIFKSRSGHYYERGLHLWQEDVIWFGFWYFAQLCHLTTWPLTEPQENERAIVHWGWLGPAAVEQHINKPMTFAELQRSDGPRETEMELHSCSPARPGWQLHKKPERPAACRQTKGVLVNQYNYEDMLLAVERHDHLSGNVWENIQKVVNKELEDQNSSFCILVSEDVLSSSPIFIMLVVNK